MTPERDTLELLSDLRAQLSRDYNDTRARDEIRRLAQELENEGLTLPRRQRVTEVSDVLPKALLSCADRRGALLSEGQICLLSAEGGIGKSALAVSIAVAVAMADGINDTQQLRGRVFDGYGAHVLYATYEDPKPVLARMAKTLIAIWDPNNPSQHSEVLDKISLLDIAGWPLFGPEAERGGSYNARPGPLPGWTALWAEAADAGAKLIILDPALAAYVGEANAPAPVREFLSAVAREAGRIGAGVILLAHSTKSARGKTADPFDPGLVAGSGAWADGVRGVMTMGWDDEEPGRRVLRVPKANWGPSRITIGLDAIRHDNGAIVGFDAVGKWNNGPKPTTTVAVGSNGRTGYDPTE